LHKRLAAGRPADHRMTISLTNGRKLGLYITGTSCTCTDARCCGSRLKLRTSAPGLRHSEEARADSHSVTARSRSWSGNSVRRVGRNSPPRLDRQLEFGHEPTRDTAHSSSSRFGGFWNAPPREVSTPPVFATARFSLRHLGISLDACQPCLKSPQVSIRAL
jgi:hypothetical protein